MNSIYLNKRELDDILIFMSDFPDCHNVELIVEGDNGIGTVLTAKLHGVKLHGHTLAVSKVISDESDW